ncbi:hypothetical protein U1Q18_025388 [Sarracenia purpurea var. burkii]
MKYVFERRECLFHDGFRAGLRISRRVFQLIRVLDITCSHWEERRIDRENALGKPDLVKDAEVVRPPHGTRERGLLAGRQTLPTYSARRSGNER